MNERPTRFDLALAAARPTSTRDGVRRLHLGAVLAKAVGLAPLPKLGRFEVHARIGAGGMGVVFKGRDPDSGQTVAIKLLDGGERERFQREAFALRAIRHPHVVRYLDHGVTDDGMEYLVMDFLDGEDLANRLLSGPLSIDESAGLSMQLAHALNAAHLAGVIHRDVKPSNVILVERRLDEPRLIDFGIAGSRRPSLDGRRLTATGVILGSPHYMAPEQLRGATDPRTDVYGLGATLFEMLTGAPPFSGEDWAALLHAIATQPAPDVRSLRPEAPAALAGLIASMLAKDRADRPAGMPAVIEALAAQRAPEQPSLATPRPTPRPASQPDALPPIIGRARELNELLGLLDEALRLDVAVTALVTGPAGLGKTHLLQALAARVGSPWTCGHLPAAGLPAPALLLLEDVDRLDEDGRRMLASVLANPPRALVATARDPAGLPEVLLGAPEDQHHLRLVLAPLHKRAAEQLLQSLLGIPAELVAEIAGAAAGNPGRLLELGQQASALAKTQRA